MLEGVVPFPPEFATHYRKKGYWEDRSLAETFGEIFERFGDRVAVIGAGQAVTYSDIDQRSTHLALKLLELGLKSQDRVLLVMPNVVEFTYVYFALQKIGAIPIMALPAHRYREISQFVSLSGAVATITPDRIKDFSFIDLIRRVREDQKQVRLSIVYGDAPNDFVSIGDLLARSTTKSHDELRSISIEPTDPALFLLSGGTTGIPKLIPRTHNDYVYNSKMAVSVCDVDSSDVLLDILPIGHNLPLACPGLQGFLLKGAKVVFDTTTRPQVIFPLIEKHGVTHIHIVPALLIKWINDPLAEQHDLSSVKVIQSGGQRLQPEVRKLAEKVFPDCIVQENFGMAEGMLLFVRLDDPEEVRMETAGRTICPDDEIRLVDENDNEVEPGEVGEFCCRGPYTLRGYYGAPEHNARAFTKDGFYRSGDLMRLHPTGNYVVAGRKKDLINRGAEKISAEEIENLILTHPAVQNVACIPMPDPVLGERMCACVILRKGNALSFDDLVAYLADQEIAKFKLPERLEILEEFPLSNFGKVSKKTLVEIVSAQLDAEKTANA